MVDFQHQVLPEYLIRLKIKINDPEYSGLRIKVREPECDYGY